MSDTVSKPKYVVFAKESGESEAKVLDVFFRPKSVAVVGATRDVKGLGGSVLDNIIKAGYTGPVFPINPKAPEIAGLKAYPSVLDVPEPVDLAVVTTPARFVPQIVEQCGQKGCRGMIIISAGFREIGPEGRKLEKDIEEIGKRYGMRIIGPNVLGVVDTFTPPQRHVCCGHAGTGAHRLHVPVRRPDVGHPRLVHR